MTMRLKVTFPAVDTQGSVYLASVDGDIVSVPKPGDLLEVTREVPDTYPWKEVLDAQVAFVELMKVEAVCLGTTKGNEAVVVAATPLPASCGSLWLHCQPRIDFPLPESAEDQRLIFACISRALRATTPQERKSAMADVDRAVDAVLIGGEAKIKQNIRDILLRMIGRAAVNELRMVR
jgi:hypothetical protein